MWAEPSPDCQLTGPDFPVWKSCFSGRSWVLGDWERGLPRAWKLEREYFKQTSTVCVPVSPAHQSDNQGHVITRALSYSGSTLITLEDVAISDVRAGWVPSSRKSIKWCIRLKCTVNIHLKAKHYEHKKQSRVNCNHNALCFESVIKSTIHHVSKCTHCTCWKKKP